MKVAAAIVPSAAKLEMTDNAIKEFQAI